MMSLFEVTLHIKSSESYSSECLTVRNIVSADNVEEAKTKVRTQLISNVDFRKMVLHCEEHKYRRSIGTTYLAVDLVESGIDFNDYCQKKIDAIPANEMDLMLVSGSCDFQGVPIADTISNCIVINDFQKVIRHELNKIVRFYMRQYEIDEKYKSDFSDTDGYEEIWYNTEFSKLTRHWLKSFVVDNFEEWIKIAKFEVSCITEGVKFEWSGHSE